MEICESGSVGSEILMKHEVEGRHQPSPLSLHLRQEHQMNSSSSSQMHSSTLTNMADDDDDIEFHVLGRLNRSYDNDMSGIDRGPGSNGAELSLHSSDLNKIPIASPNMFHSISGMVAQGDSEQSGDRSSPFEGGIEHASAPGTPKPPVGQCKVCGDEATGMYFGALVCVPCKVTLNIVTRSFVTTFLVSY